MNLLNEKKFVGQATQQRRVNLLVRRPNKGGEICWSGDSTKAGKFIGQATNKGGEIYWTGDPTKADYEQMPATTNFKP